MNYDDAIRMLQNAAAHRQNLYAQMKSKYEDAANEQAIGILRAAKKIVHAEDYLRIVAR